jgi:hypothetical protein
VQLGPEYLDAVVAAREQRDDVARNPVSIVWPASVRISMISPRRACFGMLTTTRAI